jgi:hypothetical protein
MSTPPPVQQVDVRNFDMSFGRMVWFMIKWAFATIPALVILIAVGLFATTFIGGLVTAVNRTVTSNPETATRSGYVSDPYIPPPPMTKEAEIARAQEAFKQGKYMEAYGYARSASIRRDLSKREKALVQSVQEQAWRRQQAAAHR